MALTIKVPATSANIGLGFDSLGIAVNLYLTLHVEEPASELGSTPRLFFVDN